MVRVNIINPRFLADQHLVAEYLEILMLISHARLHPSISHTQERYCLGKGHIRFFKNKLRYLKRRHERIKAEMRRREFRATKSVSLADFPKSLLHSWRPQPGDSRIIKRRLLQKIRKRPGWYRYCGKRKSVAFFAKLLAHA